jgi:hypothetical protein
MTEKERDAQMKREIDQCIVDAITEAQEELRTLSSSHGCCGTYPVV